MAGGKDRVIVFDTTLRDGEQSAGINLNVEEKVQIALKLSELNVDVIEAGFPAASPGDMEAVSRIASAARGPIIAALARLNEGDIKKAYEAVRLSERPRIHTFIATSPIHMQYKLKMTEKEVLESVRRHVSYARSLLPDVEFSAEDASRSNLDFLVEVFKLAIECGASTINIPDTVGYAYPEEFGAFVGEIIKRVGAEGVVWSVHCHDDLGMAVANSLAAIRAGARQVECTINGIGERAGNASLEEIVMALRTRKDVFGVETGINTRLLYETSRMVSRLTGVPVPPNKAIVGANAFAHESGIHQHGVLCNKATYEIMRPEDVGVPGTTIYLGKHSGKHALAKKLEEMGYKLSPEQLERAFELFKRLCDRKKFVSEADIEALVIGDILEREPNAPELVSYEISISGNSRATATISIRMGDEVISDAAVGNGPIDASYRAIRRIVGMEPELLSFKVEAVSERSDAVGEATVILSLDGIRAHGRGASTDIVEASIKAYISALGHLMVLSRVNREEARS